MTADEWADKVMAETKHAGHRYPDDAEGSMRNAIRDVVEAAIAEAREAWERDGIDWADAIDRAT